MFEDIIKRFCMPLEPQVTDLSPQLTQLAEIKAVIFDIYGTLLISGSGDVGTATAKNNAEALTQSLVVSGFEGNLEQAGQIGIELFQTEIQEWHKAGRAAGADVPEIEVTKVWRKIIHIMLNTETLRGSDELDTIRKLALEYECRVNPVYPMPYALETIHALRENGKALGIVSNAQFYTPLLFPALMGKSLEELGFPTESCIWSYKELKSKPSSSLFPKIGKYLSDQHGIGLNEAVYVGNDMLNDIYTASQAGCKTILFAGDQRSLRLREQDARCKSLKPDAVITSLQQLLELI